MPDIRYKFHILLLVSETPGVALPENACPTSQILPKGVGIERLLVWAI